jgi:hypothetical protein
MLLSLLLASLLIHTSIISCSASATMVVRHVRTVIPDGFIHNGSPSFNESITIRMALASSNISGLEQKLMRISDPSDAEYGQWLTKEEVFTSIHFAKSLCLNNVCRSKPTSNQHIRPSPPYPRGLNSMASIVWYCLPTEN